MTIEQKLKAALGEQAFAILVLSNELEQARTRIAELETQLEKSKHKPHVVDN